MELQLQRKPKVIPTLCHTNLWRQNFQTAAGVASGKEQDLLHI